MKIDGIGSVDITAGIERKQATEEQKFEEYLRKAYSDGDKQKLKDACREFEALFMQLMYRQMKRTVPKSDFLPESTARKIFEEMLDEELIDNAKERGVGIADVLYRQLSLNMDKMFTVNHEENNK
ncbi:MAG TPA: flagellar biosynthesis protein FlgJ [Ruminiclostridium sp.]|jgi:flagellar protein FlgJ|nr:flagellar biosynthesis protein FlgJ [Clostridiaceae bacterium]HAA25256.1 flagellar biosynthesis protein FlgJ [Ruminiclostridium sp.]